MLKVKFFIYINAPLHTYRHPKRVISRLHLLPRWCGAKICWKRNLLFALGLAATTDAASLLKLEIFSFALVDAEVLVSVFRSRFGGECTGDGVGEALIGERSAMGGACFLLCCATGKYCEYTSSRMEIRNEYFSIYWQRMVEILTWTESESQQREHRVARPWRHLGMAAIADYCSCCYPWELSRMERSGELTCLNLFRREYWMMRNSMHILWLGFSFPWSTNGHNWDCILWERSLLCVCQYESTMACFAMHCISTLGNIMHCSNLRISNKRPNIRFASVVR